MKTVCILGAGPSGLVTGLFLARKGWDVKIFEKANIIGGMCRSWKWDDFILDTGPHIFHTSNKQLWNFWKKNFGELLIEGKYFAKNIPDDNLKVSYDYPISNATFDKMPVHLKYKIKNELKKNDYYPIANNFKEQIINQVGPTLQKMFFQGYPEKVWGESVEDLTSEWAPKRIKIHKKKLPFFGDENTAVGKYGTGSIYEKIKKEIVKLGGKIYLDHKITNFRFKNNQINQIIFDKKKSYVLKKDELLISSLPINLTAGILGYKSKLKFRGIRSIYISVNKKRVFPLDTDWIYYASKKIIFNRISEHKVMTQYIAPKNKTILCAEITYSKNDKIDKLNFKEISKIVKKNLIEIGLIDKKDILKFNENKEPFVYPVQFKDYKYELKKTLHFVEKFNNLYSIGTGGEFDYSDSQIIFLKCKDLCDNLDDKFSLEYQTLKNTNKIKLNNKVFLNKKCVGENQKPFIIAEAGLNHNGNIDIAKKLIDEAKKINCDAIKFQTFTPNDRVSKKYKSANYAEKADGLQEDIHEMFQKNMLTKKDLKIIFQYAKKKKIEIFSTPFGLNDVDYLEKLGVKFYKIASVDLINLPLIKKVALTGKPLILSTGMSNFSNIEEAVETFKNTGNKNLILLHCLSSYPANELEMNLNSIKTLKNIYKIPVGLSDHFPGLNVSVISLAIGANIIERHFTLNKNMEGPDHILSSETNEMEQLVNLANNINNILGDGQKRIQPSEFATINSQRKCIYAHKTLIKGQKIKANDLTIKGPSGGILPKYLDLILGKRINKNIQKDYPVSWQDLLNE